MRKGLDETGRNDVLRLMANRASGVRVREAITNRVRSTNFDMAKNVQFLDEMRRRGYNESAALLVKYLEE